ncbi:hypothetical protein P170DRAFT_465284 [Aspergillus steynii IBT 23096]|uniref:Uncharacterized protein n=1 Tax=Aspergillus steynii IBT 23096 TaxID=1392250 RepID=A0A2I2G482_9EURO|nr:uncharacterized protein P170DRAFT_465284 [Aspergillus steynii IBT 23096]PLB47682.1 hypothetical protein P170DRAFT_465284 [Aspergillus steynii IBT 23096]
MSLILYHPTNPTRIPLKPVHLPGILRAAAIIRQSVSNNRVLDSAESIPGSNSKHPDTVVTSYTREWVLLGSVTGESRNKSARSGKKPENISRLTVAIRQSTNAAESSISHSSNKERKISLLLQKRLSYTLVVRFSFGDWTGQTFSGDMVPSLDQAKPQKEARY